jgi:Pectate lyase superfamily protein
MCAAIGGASVSGRPSRGDLWVDVRDYGAKGDGGITDNASAFQAAVDAAIAKVGGLPFKKGIVFIPSAPQFYLVSRSIWVDSDNIEIQGEGWGSLVWLNGYFKQPVFIFGIRRIEHATVNGQVVTAQIDASYRPDLFGKLDTSAAPTPGAKWGIRTNGSSFVQFQANSLSSGVKSSAGYPYLDNWTETTKLTLEFCIDPPDGQNFPPLTPLLGMGDIIYETSPILVYVSEDPTQLQVTFRTNDQDSGLFSPKRAYTISLAGSTPPFRIALQFDLDNAVTTAFVNGIQVAPTSSSNLDPSSPCPFTPGSGLRFSQNESYPFLIGAHGWKGPTSPTIATVSGIDLRLYGLRLSNTIRYRSNGTGQHQQRVDSPTSSINDAYAYFGNDANTVYYLSCSDNPATSGRNVTAINGSSANYPGITTGLFLNTTNAGGIFGNAIRDIAVMGAGDAGQTICLGGVLEMVIENVMAASGFNGIGSWNMYSNYIVYLDNCWIGGSDAPYYGAFQLTDARNVYFYTSGRVSIRYLGGSGNWENAFVSHGGPNNECVAKLRNGTLGGSFAFSNIHVDFEGETLSLAGFYCEALGLWPSTCLRLTDIYLGSTGPTASLIMLRDGNYPLPNPNVSPCRLVVDNLQCTDTTYRALVDVDGPLWYGDVYGGDPQQGTRFVDQGTWGSNANVLVHETLFVAPPRTLYWYRGAHVLEVRSPAEGQYAEWRCTATGEYGTSTPPVWAGLNPVCGSSNSLAAYVLNHAYMTAAIN